MKGTARLLILHSAVLGLVAVGCSPFPTATNPDTRPTIAADTVPTTTSTLLSTTEAPAPDSTLTVSAAETSTDVQESGAQDTGGIDEFAPWPTSADAMAADLSQVEVGIRAPQTSGDPQSNLAAAGRRQQLLYRLLDQQPDWADTVLANADPAVASAVRLNWSARSALSALVQSEGVHDTLPAWRIIEPEPAERLLSLYKKASADTGVPWTYLAAINLIETRMGRITGVSTAGAIGPMQFLPTTWAECCEGDPADPADAIPGAATYLVVRGGPDNMAKAVRGYNNSGYYVDAVTAISDVLAQDEQAYYAYHAWEVNFLSSVGLLNLPVGYVEESEVDAAAWLADNPDRLLFAR